MEERYRLFTTLLVDISRNIKRLKTVEMAKHGLKSIHLSCLHYIYSEGSMSLKELCDSCRDDKANISRSLRLLVEKNYVLPDRNTKGKFVLTPQGVALTEMLERRIEAVVDEASLGLTDESRKMMYEGLKQISENLVRLSCGESCV